MLAVGSGVAFAAMPGGGAGRRGSEGCSAQEIRMAAQTAWRARTRGSLAAHFTSTGNVTEFASGHSVFSMATWAVT